MAFDHPEIDNWRNSLNRGLMDRYKQTGIILTGGVDDIWKDPITKQLIIVDYKSKAKIGRVDKKDYLEDPFHEGYKTQMDFYAYLLSGMGFSVHTTSYFLVCNAKRDEEEFNKSIRFDEYLITNQGNNDWMESRLNEMGALMNQYEIPESNYYSKNCTYAYQYSKYYFQEIQVKIK